MRLQFAAKVDFDNRVLTFVGSGKALYDFVCETWMQPSYAVVDVPIHPRSGRWGLKDHVAAHHLWAVNHWEVVLNGRHLEEMP